MDRLPDEVLQLILNEQSKPSSFVKVNRSLRAFASDAYVRARYFLARHGKSQAMFYALGRGDIVTERVIKVLLSCGAHVSRHLIQLAVQHYHHGYVSFINRPWVRSLPFVVFARFLVLACARFEGDFKLPSKNDPDDGTKFRRWINEREREIGSDAEKEARAVVEELIRTWKFQPVCDEDPAIAHFALSLAVEPKLLVLAVANGYCVDPVYRDYIFRRMLTLPSKEGLLHTSVAERKNKLLSTLRDVCKSQESPIFLSRTVAAEICLEAKIDKVAYDVLKSMDQEGLLRFDLITLVQDLIKSLVPTRSIVDPNTVAAIHYLFNDLPAHAANDAGVRHAVLLTVFATSLTAHIANARLLELGLRPDPADAVPGVRQVYRIYHHTSETLSPISRDELVPVLLSPYVHTHHAIATYARFYAFYPNELVDDMLKEVALACLKLQCKGQMLESLTRRYTGLVDILGQAIKEQAFDLDALPARDALDETKKRFRVALACEDGASVSIAKSMIDSYLDDLTHETPPPLLTARWVVDTYSSMSVQAAIFADHVVANSAERKPDYWDRTLSWAKKDVGTLEDVPMTMKHWEILARLGRIPSVRMVERVTAGETFYQCAEDYLTQREPSVELEAPVEPEMDLAAITAVEVSAPSARPCEAVAEKPNSCAEVESDDDNGSSSGVDGGSEPTTTASSSVAGARANVKPGADQVKAEPGKLAAMDVEGAQLSSAESEDGFECNCHSHCHPRCQCDCHSDLDADDAYATGDDADPLECCVLGLDCPERRAFFATPAERKVAFDKAGQMRVVAENAERIAMEDRQKREERDQHEGEMKYLKKRIEEAQRELSHVGAGLEYWELQLDRGISTAGLSDTIPTETIAQLQEYPLSKINEYGVDVESYREDLSCLEEELEYLDKGAAERERQSSLWVSAMGELHRTETKRLAETRKRLGLQCTAKSPFLSTLDYKVGYWREALDRHREKGQRQREP
ncbi:unnamed protein product [Peniophora sp. CBMAI 1063]|nr:unnamed protein product [Peniophora sp. CBMAI 1063]